MNVRSNFGMRRILAMLVATVSLAACTPAGSAAPLAFGGNRYGKLGDGTTQNHHIPTRILDNKTSALVTPKKPWAWDRHTPIRIMDNGVQAVAGGWDHTLIVKTDGSLWACGRNDHGQLGDGTTIMQYSPEQIMDSGVQAVAAGFKCTLILKTDGSLWACGKNKNGLLGDGTLQDRHTPVKIMDSGVQAVTAGQGHTLIIKTDGSLWAYGANGFGELGDGTTQGRQTPVQIMDSGVAAVAAGFDYTLIVKTDGSLWACGRNKNGQLGDGTTENRTSPVQIMDSGVQAVAAGFEHTLILKTDGSLWACGKNKNGQLGDGTRQERHTPVQIMDSGVQAVAAGCRHTLILKTDGSLWACGFNDYGQLGDDATEDRLTLMYLPMTSMSTDGSIWVIGCNSHGQVWDGTTQERLTSVQIMESGSGARGMSGGDTCALILKTNGSLWLCGYYSHGQWGDGATQKLHMPVQIMDSGVQTITTGFRHTLILKTDGSLWACGWNRHCQLREDTAHDICTPVQIIASGVKAVSARRAHILILKTDGSLWACGYDSHDKRGDGTTQDRHTPEQSMDSSVTGVRAKWPHLVLRQWPVSAVTVAESDGATSVTEGGATDTYTVTLDLPPVGDVTITIVPDAQITVNPTTLTFKGQNWNVPHTVTVTAVDDAVAEGPHTGTITHRMTSFDPIYNGIAVPNVMVQIADNNTTGVTDATTSEGLVTDPPGKDITFTPANWNQPQTVTVTDQDDDSAYLVGLTVPSADANDNDFTAPSANLTNKDDDTPWECSIALTHADKSSVTFGMASGATDGFDTGIDVETATPATTAAGVYFDQLPMTYEKDYRPVAAAADWLLIAQADADNDVEMTWSLPAEFPTDRYLTMFEVTVAPGRSARDTIWTKVGNSAIDMASVHSVTVSAGETRAFVIRFGEHLTADLRLEPGWNLVSLPFEPINPAVSSIFSDATRTEDGPDLRDAVRGTVNAGYVWTWMNGGYQPATALHAGVGYWVYMNTAAVIEVAALPSGLGSLSLQRGWNLVGIPGSAPAAIPDDPRLRGRCSKWNAATQVYEVEEEMIPFSGVWLNAAEAFNLSLSR